MLIFLVIKKILNIKIDIKLGLGKVQFLYIYFLFGDYLIYVDYFFLDKI